jgi:hypothetical protein
MDPATAGAHPRTARAYMGVKNKMHHRAIMNPRVAKQVSNVPRDLRTETGMTGSWAMYTSFRRKTGKAKADKTNGVVRMRGPDRPRRKRTMVVVNSRAPE